MTVGFLLQKTSEVFVAQCVKDWDEKIIKLLSKNVAIFFQNSSPCFVMNGVRHYNQMLKIICPIEDVCTLQCQNIGNFTFPTVLVGNAFNDYCRIEVAY